ncbi:hypothetical protein CPLU01_11655 [Colletotrichum plurivorum]|uniref:SnoaL-like domain-containing protein n=1 Tax=Colletotrichum plurivorum TaxID=2175906 RepID=A0A8H6K2D7_9PEZI|nr:hypothetical protein CPLU01_11655 [Colletotrichum plurivorum]
MSSALPTQATLPPAVQALLDKDAIRTAIYRVARGSDRKTRSLVEAGYHPGAAANHGVYDGPAEGLYDATIAPDPTAAAHHQIGHSLIEIGADGVSARAETYCTANIVVGGEGSEWMTLLVRYVDRFEKRGGEWRIANRVVVYDGASKSGFMGRLPRENVGVRDETDYSRTVFED